MGLYSVSDVDIWRNAAQADAGTLVAGGQAGVVAHLLGQESLGVELDLKLPLPLAAAKAIGNLVSSGKTESIERASQILDELKAAANEILKRGIRRGGLGYPVHNPVKAHHRRVGHFDVPKSW